MSNFLNPVTIIGGGTDTIAVGQNALSTTAEQVVAANNTRRFLEITNDDAAIKVYIGGTSGVTTSTGHVVKPGAAIVFEGYTGPIFMIAASGTPTVTYCEIG